MRNEEFTQSYEVLRKIASSYLRSTSPMTLQTTSLVHEAYLKLAARPTVTLRGSQHARALMAKAMRQVLIDHIRRLRTEKHRPPEIRLVHDDVALADGSPLDGEVMAVHQAVDQLEKTDKELARVLELAYFGGYRQDEIAEILGVSDRTVRARIVRARDSLKALLQA